MSQTFPLSQRSLLWLLAAAAAMIVVMGSAPAQAQAASSQAQPSSSGTVSARAAVKLSSASVRRCKARARKAARHAHRPRKARRAALRRCLASARAAKRSRPPAPAPEPTPTPEPAPAPTTSTGTLFSDSFTGSDGIITSADAYWKLTDTLLARDLNWEGETGTMFRRSEAARSTTNVTRMFRFWTKRSDFGDVKVEMDLRTLFYHAGDSSMPATDWDGVKLWLRRQVVNGSSSANVKPALYSAEVNRRQGNVIIQKKCGGQDNYVVIANTPWSGSPNPAKLGQWEHVGGTVHTNSDGSVTVQVIRDGAVVLSGTDAGAGGCAPITAAGKVGVRGDNAEFDFDNFLVTAN